MKKKDNSEKISQLKKILWLENGEILGGAEMFSLDMFSHLLENFSDPIEIIYCSHSIHPKLKEQIEKIQSNLPHYISIKTQKIFLPQLKKFSLKTFWNIFVSVKKLRKKIQVENFSHVHANTVRAGFILSIAGLFLKVRKSFFSHDYTAPIKWLKFGTKTFQKIFACSYPVKKFIHQAGVKYSDIYVIENGVDPQKFSQIFRKSITKIEKNIPRKFGVLGRITEWKGQLVVLKAVENLFAQYGREKFKNIEFHFFGEPSSKKEDQEFFIRLKHFVSENKLNKHIFFHGFTPLIHALKQIDVIIHSSYKPEPFGRAPLEGAISGKFLLLSNIGTPAQIFENKKTALFFEAKNLEDLSKKIWYTLTPKNTTQVFEITKKSYDMVLKNFNLKKISQNFWKHFL